jgi:hypothetical protein
LELHEINFFYEPLIDGLKEQQIQAQKDRDRK